MKRENGQHKLDIYTELCPASAMAIIGCGLLTVTMGELPLGAGLAFSGIAVGLAGPVARAILERRITRR